MKVIQLLIKSFSLCNFISFLGTDQEGQFGVQNVYHSVASSKSKYKEYLEDGKINLLQLNTHQQQGSANGCVIIAALVVALHLKQATGLTSQVAEQIIDNHCKPLLQEIRGNSLEFLNPSNAITFLMDKKILADPSNPNDANNYMAWVDHCVGDVTNPRDMLELLHRFQGVQDNSNHAGCKVGALFFFHSHAVGIVKHCVGHQFQFELVESLPGLSGGIEPHGTRLQCHDLESLQVLLAFYTSNRFTDSDLSFISCNDFNNSNLYLDTGESAGMIDPRLFECYFWAGVERQNPDKSTSLVQQQKARKTELQRQRCLQRKQQQQDAINAK